MGTWHVLVHYKDSATNNPDVERWEDRIWVFAREGDRLRWTDYPIVVFDDQSGRFEKTGAGLSRVLGYWEPNPAQLAQIRSGLEINSRGSRTKTLRGSPEKGWTSARKGAHYQSARFITFTETWTIENPLLPRFVREDVMGSASTESFEGRTVYETRSIESGGDVLRGIFNRDGSRKGTFRMMRSGTVQPLKTRYTSEGERAYVAFFGEVGRSLYKGEVPGGGSEADLRAAIEAGTFGDDERRALRVQIEAWLADHYKVQGNDARAFRPQIQSLARKIVRLVVDDGKSFEEVGKMLQDGRLRP